MRALVIYILIPCLFLLKGHYSALPGAGQHVQATPAKAAFKELQDPASQAELSFLDEDDKDEDECSSEKEKITQSCPANNAALFTAFNTGLRKTSNRFYKHFSYLSSDKYIFHRKIII